MTPTNPKTIKHSTIRTLRDEALAAGDQATADDCLTVLAYGGGEQGAAECDAARRRIAKVLDDARAMGDSE